jgi:hypothetical protein
MTKTTGYNDNWCGMYGESFLLSFVSLILWLERQNYMETILLSFVSLILWLERQNYMETTEGYIKIFSLTGFTCGIL